MNCRFCNSELKYEVVDLGFSPPSNAFVREQDLLNSESYFPLKLFVCSNCYLVQIDELEHHKKIFDHEYVYFSSYSSSWLKHCKQYVDYISERLALDDKSLVIEIASNDGYLLQYFKQKNIPVLGIEPTANTAEVAIQKGINTRVDFFGNKLAQELASDNIKADLIIGNNVLAHVPDINDFVDGLNKVLSKNGVVTMEFPHLLKMLDQNQFDTIYHEHFSYLSLWTVKQLFESKRLQIFDVEEIPTHGGSLRIFAAPIDCKKFDVSSNVELLLTKELDFGLTNVKKYKEFQNAANNIKNSFMSFLIDQYYSKKKVIAYGAAAKGNTLINFTGARKDLISYIVDASPHKKGKFTPGMHIPVVEESRIKEDKPDFVIILPWNIKDEITNQLSYIKEWGGKFVVAIPELEIF